MGTWSKKSCRSAIDAEKAASRRMFLAENESYQPANVWLRQTLPPHVVGRRPRFQSGDRSLHDYRSKTKGGRRRPPPPKCDSAAPRAPIEIGELS